jgi:8-oxo-dGTP pyrophosphatase MutT (NUDIX family)
MNINPTEIKHKLLQTQVIKERFCPPLPGINEEVKQPAAVLIPLLQDQGAWKILFIKRTHHEKDRHSGQIAFPGGRADDNDSSLQDTALREAEEEIGINPCDVEILGQSCSINTVSNYVVTPFVCLLPWPYTLTISQIEVEKVLLIPLNWLINPQHHRTKSWKPDPTAQTGYPVIFFDEYQGEVLWGATAQIVRDFLDIIGASV